MKKKISLVVMLGMLTLGITGICHAEGTNNEANDSSSSYLTIDSLRFTPYEGWNVSEEDDGDYNLNFSSYAFATVSKMELSSKKSEMSESDQRDYIKSALGIAVGGMSGDYYENSGYSSLFQPVRVAEQETSGYQFHITATATLTEDYFIDSTLSIMLEESTLPESLKDGVRWEYMLRTMRPVSEEFITDPVVISKVQTDLNELGYDCGAADGVAGEKTKAQIVAYKQNKGLPVDENITDELLWSLCEDNLNND